MDFPFQDGSVLACKELLGAGGGGSGRQGLPCVCARTHMDSIQPWCWEQPWQLNIGNWGGGGCQPSSVLLPKGAHPEAPASQVGEGEQGVTRSTGGWHLCSLGQGQGGQDMLLAGRGHS